MASLLAGPCDRCSRNTACQTLRLLRSRGEIRFDVCRRCLEDLEDMLSGWTSERMDVLGLITDEMLGTLIEEYLVEPPLPFAP
jgi:hypothetical protein